MGKFDEANLQKAYAQAQGKYDKTATITIRPLHIGRKIQTLIKATPQPGFNISPYEDPYSTSGLTQEASEDKDTSLLGGASLALDPSGDDISAVMYIQLMTRLSELQLKQVKLAHQR